MNTGIKQTSQPHKLTLNGITEYSLHYKWEIFQLLFFLNYHFMRYIKFSIKKVVSDSLGLVDFAVRLKWTLFLICPMGKWSFLGGNSDCRKTEVNRPHQKLLLGYFTLGLRSACQVEHARMASCKLDFLCNFKFQNQLAQNHIINSQHRKLVFTYW